MDRQLAIKILKRMIKHGINYDGCCQEPLTKDEEEACQLALNSLEIDAKYNLIHEDAKAAGPWIDVNVDDPDIEQDVLVCDIDGDIYKGYLSVYDGWQRSEDFEKIKSVVAWMPLPEPYKGAAG